MSLVSNDLLPQTRVTDGKRHGTVRRSYVSGWTELQYDCWQTYSLVETKKLRIVR